SFLGLGKKLGFTFEEIEQGYYKKNEVNHQRQDNGY
ncbi:dUTP diphosphatase, partial [Bacillus anthracis]